MLQRVCFILIGNFILSPLSTAQNLVQNGSFETHGPLDCLSCSMWPEKFAAILPPWRIVSGGHPLICDDQYKRDGVAIQQGSCPFDQVRPPAGNAMMEMEYAPSCYDHDFKTRGCSAYLGTALSAPLVVGKIYEVSFWVYILPSKDCTYAHQIGFNLYPDVIRNPTGKLLEGTGFLLDTVLYQRWDQVKWRIRPVCNLRFLVLGVFRGENGPPVNSNGDRNRFYIDAVQIMPLADSAVPATVPVIPYCKYQVSETLWHPIQTS